MKDTIEYLFEAQQRRIQLDAAKREFRARESAVRREEIMVKKEEMAVRAKYGHCSSAITLIKDEINYFMNSCSTNVNSIFTNDEDARKIPNIMNKYNALQNAIKAHQIQIDAFATYIRHAPNLLEADKKCAEMKKWHKAQFVRIEVDIQQIPWEMQETIKTFRASQNKAVNVGNPADDMLQKQKITTSKDTERYFKEIEESIQQIQQRDEQIQQRDEQIQQRDEQIQQMGQQLQQKDKQIAQQDRENGELRIKYEASCDENMGLRKENSELRQDKVDLRADKNSLQVKVASLEEIIQKLNDQHIADIQKIHSFEIENLGLKGRIQELEHSSIPNIDSSLMGGDAGSQIHEIQ